MQEMDGKKDKVLPVSKGGMVDSESGNRFGRGCRDYRKPPKESVAVPGLTLKNFSEPGLLLMTKGKSFISPKDQKVI